MTFSILKDEEHTGKSGGHGMFQISILENHEGKDVTNQIDVGLFFSDYEALAAYLSPIFNIPAKEIDFIDLNDYNEEAERDMMGLNDDESAEGFDYNFED